VIARSRVVRVDRVDRAVRVAGRVAATSLDVPPVGRIRRSRAAGRAAAARTANSYRFLLAKKAALSAAFFVD
jgi:hypothetical protein